MTYENAIKNKDKPEFQWDKNQNVLDFHILMDEEDNYYYSGSFCYDEFDWYQSSYYSEKYPTMYSVSDFKREAIKSVKKFLNRKNKKEYQIDTILDYMRIVLYNYETDNYDDVKLILKLTYCP